MISYRNLSKKLLVNFISKEKLRLGFFNLVSQATSKAVSFSNSSLLRNPIMTQNKAGGHHQTNKKR